MALETGNYISSLVKTNPLSSDNISEGDDHLQLIKKVLQRTFPMGTDTSLDSGVGPDQAVQVLIAEASPGPTIDTSASGNAARAMGLLWLDTSNNLLKIRNQANDAWITLSIDPETSNSVDINAGTIDGVTIEDSIIGAGTPAAGTFVALEGTAVKATSSLTLDTGVDMIFEGATADAYETTVTVTDPTADRTVTLPNATDTLVGKATTDTLTNKTMTSSGNTFDDSTSSVKGMASFSTDNFSVSSGAVTVKDAGIANAELANMAANTVKVRDANSSGVPSDVALATTEILIGDGTGFTAAALSGDATMTNAGAVTVAKIRGETVSTGTVANDQYLKYSSDSSEWQFVTVVGDDKLTTKGDLLVYNTVDSETRLGVGTNNKVVTANSSATNGLDWQYVAGDSIRMGSDAAGDVLYFDGTDYARLAKGAADEVLTMNTGATAPEWAAATTGDITGVTAGTGLSGGGTSGSVTLNVEASQTQITAVGTIATGVWNGTDVAVADGGTGSGTASGARTNLGVAIGSDVQAYDAQLADVAGLAVTNGGIIVGDGSNFVLESGSTARTSLGVAIGSDVQIYNADTAVTDVTQTFTKAQIPSTQTATISTSVTLDFDTYQNFILTLGSGANTLSNPTTEASNVGQTGTIIFIQPSSSSAGTVSLASDYESIGGAGITLSTTNSQYDVVPYMIKADNSILIGSPQLNFA